MILRRGPDHRVRPLAHRDGPSSSFTFHSRGDKQWIGDLVWDFIQEQVEAHMEAWIGSAGLDLSSELRTHGTVPIE